MEPPRRVVLRKPAVSGRIGLSIPHIDRLEREGKFPRRIHLGPNSVGWFSDEIDAWLNERAAERDEPQAASE